MRNNINKAVSSPDGLRETLGYSMQFAGKIFCIVVDAESFENYDCVQIAHDILLTIRSCRVKAVIVVGCFPSRLKGKKKRIDFQRTISATRELQKRLGQSAEIVKIPQCGWNLLPSQVSAMLEWRPVVIIPAVEFKETEPVVFCDVKQVLLSLGGSVERDKIDKMIIVSDHDGIFGADKQFLHQINSGQMKEFLGGEVVTGELAIISKTALCAVEDLGIKRVHIINGTKPDELILELFTKGGSGTMIYAGKYLDVRPATLEDLDGLQGLISCQKGQSLDISYLAENLSQFLVGTIDEYVIACARVQSFPLEGKLLVSSLAVLSDYPETGLKLLVEATKTAVEQKIPTVLLAMPEVVPWWVPSEFKRSEFLQLPEAVQKKHIDKLKSMIVLSKSVS